MARVVFNKMVSSHINSSHGIQVSLERPLNNLPSVNILRPIVLRQYFGQDVHITQANDYCVT